MNAPVSVKLISRESALSALERLEARRIGWADLPEPRDARERWADHRGREGMTTTRGVRFTTAPEANSKLVKGPRPVVSLSLAPGISSGFDLCPCRSVGCTAPCVGNDLVGRASFHAPIMRARAVRSRFVLTEPASALALLVDETERETYRRAGGRRVSRRRVAQRPNAFSDIAWERIAREILTGQPFVDPYDYTKRPDREPDARYRLIHSTVETDSPADIASKLRRGPTALVIDTPRHQMPQSLAGYPLTDGDLDDYANSRPPAGHLIGLALKGNGRAKHHARRTGFTRTLDQWETMLTERHWWTDQNQE